MTNNESDALPTTDEEWRARLTPAQFAVARKAGTERAFTGEYWDNHDDGIYACVCCGSPLFSSEHKYESGSGWPSFWQPIDGGEIEKEVDRGHGKVQGRVNGYTRERANES